jgi:hypothetical protein
MEGRNLRIDLRFAESDPGRYSSLARALVALQPHAVIAYSTPIAATFFGLATGLGCGGGPYSQGNAGFRVAPSASAVRTPGEGID